MSKQILGLTHPIKRSTNHYFSESEKRVIIEEFLQGDLTKSSIWKKYTGKYGDHGKILAWMRKLGYVVEDRKKSSIFAPQKRSMRKESETQTVIQDFETLQLHKRIAELERQLKESELKSVAYQTMIDIAERDLKISIKKKFNIKPSKR